MAIPSTRIICNRNRCPHQLLGIKVPCPKAGSPVGGVVFLVRFLAFEHEEDHCQQTTTNRNFGTGLAAARQQLLMDVVPSFTGSAGNGCGACHGCSQVGRTLLGNPSVTHHLVAFTNPRGQTNPVAERFGRTKTLDITDLCQDD